MDTNKFYKIKGEGGRYLGKFVDVVETRISNKFTAAANKYLREGGLNGHEHSHRMQVISANPGRFNMKPDRMVKQYRFLKTGAAASQIYDTVDVDNSINTRNPPVIDEIEETAERIKRRKPLKEVLSKKRARNGRNSSRTRKGNRRI